MFKHSFARFNLDFLPRLHLDAIQSSIANATKFCLQNANLWPRMFAMLQVELDEVPVFTAPSANAIFS